MTASTIVRVYRLYCAGTATWMIADEMRISDRLVQWAIDEACRRRRALGIVENKLIKTGEIA